jgi:hypothetical protein
MSYGVHENEVNPTTPCRCDPGAEEQEQELDCIPYLTINRAISTHIIELVPSSALRKDPFFACSSGQVKSVS